jgi:CRISPR-associated endonuclease/helicase Cas3
MSRPLRSHFLPRDVIWAKLGRAEDTYHPLVAHSADVAAVLEAILTGNAVLAQRLARSAGLERLEESQVRLLTFLAAIHDMGKANHAFQWAPFHGSPFRKLRGHVLPVLRAWGSPPLQPAITELVSLMSIDPRDAAALLSATICHHGVPHDPADAAALLPPDAELRSAWQTDASGRDPLAEVRRLIGLAGGWSGYGGGSGGIPITPGFTHLFAGALTIADWVGSIESVFTFTPEADEDPQHYWVTARERATVLCRDIGLIPAPVSNMPAENGLYAYLWPEIFGKATKAEPTAIQRAVETMPLPQPGARLLIEDETGSGKTEAALALYARLRESGTVAGLMFALPTRATAAAMFDRVARLLPRLFDEAPPSCALAMGGDQVGLRAEGILSEAAPQLYPDDEDRPMVRWASEQVKRSLDAEVVVGTVDQALLGALAVRHADMRMAALSRHLLVVDEVHAHDRYMTTVLRRLLDAHCGWGGIAVPTSATLADAARRALGADGEPEKDRDAAAAAPYPRLSARTSLEKAWANIPLPAPAASRRSKKVAWSAGVTQAQALETAMSAASAGARVCILRNTVSGCRATFRALAASGFEHLLWKPAGLRAAAYHSRYTPPDRAALDEAAVAAFGKESRYRGVILVCTQVVEQSLDVDFDLLITDLCPMDVLLQRIGRLHRHADRARPPGSKNARVLVISPAKTFSHLLGTRTRRGSNGWGTVYEDIDVLELSLRVILGRQTIELPRENRLLVENVYHPCRRQALAEESEEWEQHVSLDVPGRDMARSALGEQSVIHFHRSYAENAQRFKRAREQQIRTRLGDSCVPVRLPASPPAFYAAGRPEVRSVDVPLHVVSRARGGQALDLDELAAGDWSETEDGAEFLLAGVGTLRYTPTGWHWPGTEGAEPQ